MYYSISVHVEDLPMDKMKHIIDKSPGNFEHYQVKAKLDHEAVTPEEHRLTISLPSITNKNAYDLFKNLLIFMGSVLGATIIDFAIYRISKHDELNHIYAGIERNEITINSPCT